MHFIHISAKIQPKNLKQHFVWEEGLCVCMPLEAYMSVVNISVGLLVCLLAYMSVCSVCISICLYVCLFGCMSLCPSVCVSVFPMSVGMVACPSVRPTVYPSMYICTFICLQGRSQPLPNRNITSPLLRTNIEKLLIFRLNFN